MSWKYIKVHYFKKRQLSTYMKRHHSKVRDKVDNYTHQLMLKLFHTILKIDGIPLRTDSLSLSLIGQGIEAFYLLPHRTAPASWSCRRLIFLVDGAVDMLTETVLWCTMEQTDPDEEQTIAHTYAYTTS